jgi:hypothetical protein
MLAGQAGRRSGSFSGGRWDAVRETIEQEANRRGAFAAAGRSPPENRR